MTYKVLSRYNLLLAYNQSTKAAIKLMAILFMLGETAGVSALYSNITIEAYYCQ